MNPYVFASLSSFVYYFVAIRMPKRMTRTEIYCTSLFSLLLNVLTDVYLDMRMHLYTYFSPGIDYIVTVYLVGLFPPISAIYLNYFPFSRKLMVKAGYVLGWTCYSVLYEFLSLKTGVLTYTGWQLWYSAFVYPVVLTVHAINLIIIRKYLK